MLVTVPLVSRSCDHFLGGFDLHLLHTVVPSAESTVLPASGELLKDTHKGPFIYNPPYQQINSIKAAQFSGAIISRALTDIDSGLPPEFPTVLRSCE